MTAANKRIGIISDFNCDWFARLLQANQTEPQLETFLYPFGQVYQSLALSPENMEYAFIWTRPQALFKNFAKAVEYCEFTDADLMFEVKQFAKKIIEFSRHLNFCFVATWNICDLGRMGGLLSWNQKFGLNYLNAKINVLLAEEFAQAKNIGLLDSDSWIHASGESAYSPKRYYSTKMPYSNLSLEFVINDLKSAIHAIRGQTKKLIVLDLDDTLWGGVVGDVGQENIILGGHHMQGEAFVDFQKSLKALQNRGIQLAIASKNNEEIALAAIDHHPCMQLRRNDFVAWQINWSDKAENILAIASEINLGLDAIVFIDNDKVQRERVREALPDVFVPDWPSDPLLFAKTLMQLNCFDQYDLTGEDRLRTQLHETERHRKKSFTSAQTMTQWLSDLEMQIVIENLHELNSVRIVQLFNKTNQMNLTTRRVSASTLAQWLEDPHHYLWAFHVNDKFGDYGLMGVMTLKQYDQKIAVTDFILSCRVMGRGVEQSMLAFACEQARSFAASAVVATYVPTLKNSPCLNFFQTSGWSEHKNYEFEWDLTKHYPVPEYIKMDSDIKSKKEALEHVE